MNNLFFDELEQKLVVLSTVRYALGRSSYVPQVIIEFVERNVSILSTDTLFCIKQDIERSVPPERYEKQWNSLHDSIERELMERGVNNA